MEKIAITTKEIIFFFILVLLVLIIVNDAYASDTAILNEIETKFRTAAAKWGAEILKYAKHLFFILIAISMVWTFIPVLFRNGSIGEAFVEILRFIAFFGFFLWLLENGPAMAKSIIDSMGQMGKEVGGVEIKPTQIVDKGYYVFMSCVDAWGDLKFGDAICCVLIGIGVYLLMTIIAVNITLQICSCWILAYAGIFLLGFGGSKWTSDIAINYFKSVLSTGIQYFTMLLLVTIGYDLINEALGTPAEEVQADTYIVLLSCCLALLLLVAKVPPLVAGIITGGSIGGGGIGAFGAGAAVGVASTAASMAAKPVRGAMHVGKAGSVGIERGKAAHKEGSSMGASIGKGALATAGYLAKVATGFRSGETGSFGGSASKDSNDSGGGEKDSGGNNDGKSGGAQDQNKKTSDLAKHAAQAAQANFKSPNATSSGTQGASPQASSVASDTVAAAAMGATQATSTVGAEAASPSATQATTPTSTSSTQTSTQGASPQSAQHIETKTSTSGSQETSQSASKASMGTTQGTTQTSNPLGSTTIQGRHIPEANYTHDAAAQARAAQAAQNIASRNLTNVSPTIQHVADRKVSSESIGQTFKRPDKRG